MGNKLFVTYIENTESVFYSYDLEGRTLTKIELPGHGTASFYGGCTFLRFDQYASPPSCWNYDAESNKLTLEKEPEQATIALEAIKIFYTAHNGKQVPIWLVKKRVTKLTPTTPVLLYGYGGFSINIMPRYTKNYRNWPRVFP